MAITPYKNPWQLKLVPIVIDFYKYTEYECEKPTKPAINVFSAILQASENLGHFEVSRHSQVIVPVWCFIYVSCIQFNRISIQSYFNSIVFS